MWRDGFGEQRTRSNNTPIGNVNAIKDDGTGANPTIVSDVYPFSGFAMFPDCRVRILVIVIFRKNSDVRPHDHIIAYNNASLAAKKGLCSDRGVITNLNTHAFICNHPRTVEDCILSNSNIVSEND